MQRVIKGGVSKRPVLAIAAALALGSIALSSLPAHASTWDGRPKLLLHLKAKSTKNLCTTYGDLSDCTQAVTNGQVGDASGPFYYMYLLVATGPLRGVGLGGNDLGVAGLQCGLNYNPLVGAPPAASGVDVFTWSLCATLEFSATGWPESGGSDLITWDKTNKCQKGEVAVAGYFYCAAYSPDTFKIVFRPVDTPPAAKVADCNSVEIPLGENDMGSAVFSVAGTNQGCNPCINSCGPTAVQPSTWSSIKGTYGSQ